MKTRKCAICKQSRGSRFCLRKGKDICWRDCNRLRVDLKCTQNCSYALRESDESAPDQPFHFKTRSDSRTEFRDLLTCEMDRWIQMPQGIFQGRIPLQMAETAEGREEIELLFRDFNIPEIIPMEYLKQRLKLQNLKIALKIRDYEDIATEYINAIISQDWQLSLQYHELQDHYTDPVYRENYIRRCNNNKILSKLKHQELISSALAEDKEKALVHFDINYGKDLTIILVSREGSWRVTARIAGIPELVNGENDAIQQLAVLLSGNRLSQVYPLLRKYRDIYFDSADIHYYFGLYYTFAKDVKKAENEFLSAVEIDPNFLEAKYNYAYTIHSSGNIAQAETLYREILDRSPTEVKVLNNLASIYLDRGQHEKAREYFRRCLDIDPAFEIASRNLDKMEKEIGK